MAGPERPPTLEHAMKLKTLACLSLITLVASIGPAAQAQTFSTIYAFSGNSGIWPQAGVTLRAGVLYGTTVDTEFSTGTGTVYQLSRVGSNWTHTVISFFSGIPYGGEGPYARVVFGPDNHLYGTTLNAGPHIDGNVFALTPQVSICRTANCFWTETVLHQFAGSPDGQAPSGDLIWDSTGNIYGTTMWGGASGLGTIFQITKSGNNWTETPIYSFTGPDGSGPIGGVIFDSNGNLFGTTAEGGLYGFGTIFELTYSIDSGWTETVLYNFQNLSDGEFPVAGLTPDGSGNLYGSASDGGTGGGGTVFELSPAGDTWTFTLLYSFTGQQGRYSGPRANLTFDTSGNLYGTTLFDGANSLGNIFKLANSQNGWVYASLYDFTGGADGASPVSNVTIDTDGTLYGTAGAGGDLTCAPPTGCGVVWMIKP